MKPLQQQVLAELAGRFGYAVNALEPLGGGKESSDGVTYRVRREGQPFVFKVIGANAENPYAMDNTRARAAFFAYLGANGVDVVAPQPNAAGNLIESVVEGKERLIAYQYPYMTGEHPSPELWTDELVQAWGHTIGRAHYLAQSYDIWQGVPVPDAPFAMLSWQAEVAGFESWCEDADVKGYWRDLRATLEALPYARETAGFIHNDPHMQNVLWEDGRIKLLDFDVASCHFFAADLAIAIQSVLFTRSGGMDQPVRDQAAADWFVHNLLAGYAQALTPDTRVLDSIGLFINYRRALLFTVMQGWLNTKPQIRDSWKKLIFDPPAVIRLP